MILTWIQLFDRIRTFELKKFIFKALKKFFWATLKFFFKSKIEQLKKLFSKPLKSNSSISKNYIQSHYLVQISCDILQSQNLTKWLNATSITKLDQVIRRKIPQNYLQTHQTENKTLLWIIASSFWSQQMKRNIN